MNNKKILVVDDEVEFCLALKEYLDEENFNTAFSHDGESACQKAIEFQPDLILLDIRMPVSDGFHFLEKFNNVKNIPIFIVTGVQSSETIEKLHGLGVYEFINKPVDLDDLKSRMEKALYI